MKTLGLLNRTTLAIACAVFTWVGIPSHVKAAPPVNVKLISANAGTTSTLAPTADPTVFNATAIGVIQSQSLGTCVNNVQLEVRFPTAADQPVVLNGTGTWTTIDGKNSLNVTLAGTATPDPANAGFYNAKYKITITGGTGAYAAATGQADIEEVVMFTSASTATATWNMKGFVVTPR
jgi:hypothetical protein